MSLPALFIGTPGAKRDFKDAFPTEPDDAFPTEPDAEPEPEPDAEPEPEPESEPESEDLVRRCRCCGAELTSAQCMCGQEGLDHEVVDSDPEEECVWLCQGVPVTEVTDSDDDSEPDFVRTGEVDEKTGLTIWRCKGCGLEDKFEGQCKRCAGM